MNGLKQRMRARVNLTTVMFACVAVLAIPFLTVITGVNPALTTAAYPIRRASHITLIDSSPLDRSIQLQGSLIAQGDSHEITELSFTIASVTGAKPLNLTDNSLKISYRDQNQRVNNLTWTQRFQGSHNDNDLLDPGELLQLTIPLTGVLKAHLGPNTAFVIDVTPPQGAILSLKRTTPAQLDTTLDLN